MELNLTGAPDADLIRDSDEASFMTDVVEASQVTPIIVDFWAPWCGPCKTLGPQLEDAVRAAKGAVKMVKVNVDEAQMIAGQLQIQSIPTVYAFYKGQPVDGFQGALPPSEIKPKGQQQMPHKPLQLFWKKTQTMLVPMLVWSAPISLWVSWIRLRPS